MQIWVKFHDLTLHKQKRKKMSKTDKANKRTDGSLSNVDLVLSNSGVELETIKFSGIKKRI